MKKKTREKLIDAYNRVFMESAVRFEPYFPVLYGPRSIGWICDEKKDLETLIPLFEFKYSSKYECGDIVIKAEERLRPAIIAIGEKTFISPASSLGDAERWRCEIRELIRFACSTISETDWQKLKENAE